MSGSWIHNGRGCGGGGLGAPREGVDDGKHAFSGIGVDLRLLEPKWEGGLGGGGAVHTRMTESTLPSVIGVDIRALGPIYERSEYPAGSAW